jgi:hypothetical protein
MTSAFLPVFNYLKNNDVATPASFLNLGTIVVLSIGVNKNIRSTTMTKENMKKLLDQPQYNLKKVFYDEARKVEKDDFTARRLAEEAFLNLQHQLEHSFVA